MSTPSPSAVVSLEDEEDEEDEKVEKAESSPSSASQEISPATPQQQPTHTDGDRIYFFDYESLISNISNEEKEYQTEHFLSRSELEDADVCCTACSKRLDHREEGEVVGHPCLGVALCLHCHSFYGDGSWTCGDDGYFEFCRWCANGGDIFCCDKCPNVFCRGCIARNLGRKKLNEIEESVSWECFVCRPEPIWSLRNLYHSIWKNNRDRKAPDESDNSKSTFIDDALKDGLTVNEIFRDYLSKASTSWKRKGPTGDEEENVKMVKKIRTILSVAHHNLRMLEQNLVDGIQKKFPHLDPGVTSAPEITEEGKKSPRKVKEDRHNESPDMFEEEASGVEEVEAPPHLTRSLDEANRQAREEVLNSSSDDEVIHSTSRSPKESPRKRLKTKKELNELRQKMLSSENEENSDREDSGKKSYERKLMRNLREKALEVDVDANDQLKKTVRIDIKKLAPEIQADLNNFSAVSRMRFSSSPQMTCC